MGAFQKRFNLSRPPLDVVNRIFETMIVPILSYNAEVLGVYNKHDFEHWDKPPNEKAHLRFCKSYLALNKRASNLGCRAEMGRLPTIIAIDKQILKYWYRLSKLSENSMVKQAFVLSQKLWEKGHKSLRSYVHSLQNVYNFPQNILREPKFTQQYTKTMMSKSFSTLKFGETT